MKDELLHYFRLEADDLIAGLGKGILELETGKDSAGVVNRLLRLAHTLKGAARVVDRMEIAKKAHDIEEIIAPHRDTTHTIPRQEIDLLLLHLDGITQSFRLLDQSTTADSTVKEKNTAPSTSPTFAKEGNPVTVSVLPTDESFQSVRVSLHDTDDLLTRLDEAHTYLLVAQQQAEQLKRMGAYLTTFSQSPSSFHASSLHVSHPVLNDDHSTKDPLGTFTSTCRNLLTELERVERELRATFEQAQSFRLVPISSLFAPMERVIRDAAQSLGKTVSLVCQGGEIRIDAHVLSVVRKALQHVVRNAVTHGIELPTQRESLGKPRQGSLSLLVTRTGEKVSILCRDDGQGLDKGALQQALIRSGRLPPTQASLSTQELLPFLLEGGISTTRTAHELSGRGVGMNVVRETLYALKGDIHVTSEPGQGTSVTLTIPISLASVHALVVGVGSHCFALPIDAIHRVYRIPGNDTVNHAKRTFVEEDGQTWPLHSLRSILTLPPASSSRSAFLLVVVVQVRTTRIALEVDHLYHVRELIMRPLPPLTPTNPFIAGVSTHIDGQPLLVIDAHSLYAPSAPAASYSPPAPSTQQTPLEPILVIDDSLTSRVLEQSILESAGFRVETANSAEDALIRANHQKFSLFVVDVEMPGMNGFEFIEHIKKIPALRDIPSILVTSLNSPEHRQRGKNVGAQAYIVKSEFDQEYFLNRVRSLVGWG